MTKEKALKAARLLGRIENLEMQLDEVHNFPFNLAERLSDRHTKYPLTYEYASEIYDKEDIEDFKELIQSKLDEINQRLEKL